MEYFELGGIKTFCLKKIEKENDKIHKDFLTIPSLHTKFLCENL